MQQQQALVNERAALAGQLRVAYVIGREEPLKLLLNQQDPLHSGRLFAYYGYFGRARAEQIAQIQAQVQRLDELDQSSWRSSRPSWRTSKRHSSSSCSSSSARATTGSRCWPA